MIPRNPGPTASLALALFHRWEPERLFVIVTVYIDESGTHDGSPVLIMAGWVGKLGQWAGFDPKWNKLLKQSKLTFFHSKEMRHSENEFRGWHPLDKSAFTQRAANIALKNLEFGFTITLSKEAFRDLYVNDNRPKKIPLDTQYGLCFRYLLSVIPPMVKDAFGGRELDINFVLEAGHKNAGDAERIFNRVKKMGLSHPEEKEIVKMLNVIAFGDKKKFPGLQAADVNAYAAFQHETSSPLEVVLLDPKSSMAEAKKIQKVPIFRLEVGETELKLFKQFILDEIKEREDYNLARAARLAAD